MMPAAKQFDPVLGVDIHIIQPPGPVPPLPIPHPFIGMVFDPMEFAPILGATVIVNGLPAAIAGTEVKCIPPHIPIGGVFVPPPPGNEGEIFMGSMTVAFDGDAASHLLHPVLTCQSIGMPAIPRLKKKAKKATLMLPTSMVLAAPGGPPVLVGGPPTISLMAMGMKVLMSGLGKAFKKLKSIQKSSKKWKAIAEKFHKKADNLADKLGVPPNIRKKMHDGVCAITGHPVDICSGRVFTDNVDIELPGPIPFVFKRKWDSTSVHSGPLGNGWNHSYDMKLAEDKQVVAIQLGDGRPVTFPSLKPGEKSFNRQERLKLFRDDTGYLLQDSNRDVHHFTKLNERDEAFVLTKISRSTTPATIQFLYDKLGFLISIIDSVGRHVKIQNDLQGRVNRVQLPRPEKGKRGTYFDTMQYRYDESGNLIQVTDALNHSWHFKYNKRLMIQETDRNGLSFYFEYDGADHNALCTRTWGDNGIYEHKLKYDLENNITIVENSLGHKTTYYHDGSLPHNIVDPQGYRTKIEYNEHHDMLKEVDELGAETFYEYDKWGNNTKIVQPNGAAIVIEYDPKGSPIKGTDVLGGEWVWEYDNQNRLTKKFDPTGRTITFDYDSKNVRRMQDSASGDTFVEYDNFGNLCKLQLPDGGIQCWKYDTLGRAIEVTNPLKNVTQLNFDLGDNLTYLIEADGNTRKFQYDPEGNVICAKDNHYNVAYSYQGMGRLASRTESSTTVKFGYNTEEQLIGIQNEHGAVYNFELDSKGNVEKESGFDRLIRTYRRDGKGRISKVNRPGNQFTHFQYDVQDNVIQALHSDASEVTFSYQTDGRLIEATNNDATVVFERDEAGRIVKEQHGDYWVTSEYNSLGLRVKMDSSLGASQTIVRNKMGQVEEIDAGEWKTTVSRNQIGFEVERSLPGGITSKWKRDKLGRPIRHEVGTFFSTQRDVQYHWDVNDRLKMIHDTMNVTTTEYDYDGFGSLSSANYGDGSIDFRMPDVVGNLFRNKNRTDRKYGKSGQLLSTTSDKGETFYRYDAEGNLISKIEPFGKQWRYEWNGAGMLIRVIRPDGGVIIFKYDALGRRISKSFGSKMTKWIWDGNNPLHEWVEFDETFAIDSSNSSVRNVREIAISKQVSELSKISAHGPPESGSKEQPITWIFDPDTFSPAAKIIGDRSFSIITDHLGTPTLMVDDHGREIWSASISVWGRVRNQKGEKNHCPFRWPGQYEDEETGLYYNGFRYYDPTSGQYMSQDPLGLKGAMPNLYSYVQDNNSWIDPLGLAGAATAELVVKGKTYTAKSKKTLLPDGPFKDLVESVKSDLKKTGMDKPFHGNCAEIRAIQKALDDGVSLDDLKGAKMRATVTKTGEFKKACDCCSGVMDDLGIKKACK